LIAEFDSGLRKSKAATPTTMPILRWYALFAFSLTAISGCGSGGDSAGPVDSWTFVGTWINQNQAKGGGPKKILFTPNTLALYADKADTEPDSSGSLTVSKDWTAENHRYFQCQVELRSPIFASSIKAFMLLRAGDKNQELGVSEDDGDYPTEIDTNSGRDWLFSRQE
jgi:hypothetical protein